MAVSGGTALEAMVVSSIVVPLAILAVICWFFWKAAKKEDAREGGAAREPRDEPPDGH